MAWFACFTLCASVGTFGVLAFLPVKPIGKGYFRTVGIIALVLAGMTALLVRVRYPYVEPFLAPMAAKLPSADMPQRPGGGADLAAMGAMDKFGLSDGVGRAWLACAAIFSLALLLQPSLAALPSRGFSPGVRWVGTLSGVALLVLPIALMDRTWLHVFGLLAAAGVLGLALDAMLLGHWYLNVPNLSFDYLKRCCLFLIGVLAVRAVVTGFVLYLGMQAVRADCWYTSFAESFAVFRQDPLSWVIVIARIGFGVVAALLFAVLAWRCAKMHSNQSATGILYAVLFMVIVGEMMGAYLLGTTGLPL